LAVDGLTAGYGAAVVIDGVSFTLGEGEALAVLGRNGTGKTTLINSIVGLTTWRAGEIRLAGRPIERLAPEARAALGIGWVPQERAIFKSLTVVENLTAVARPGPWTTERIFALFPRLAERRRNLGNALSGGEQQMLAIGRALALNPIVILLDEPLEGLAPIVAGEVLAALKRIARDEGTAAIIVEQRARAVLAIVDAALILDRGGVIVRQGPSSDLLADIDALDIYLGVRAKPPRPRADARPQSG
jgi:branched-chain amino acid transport system ATP-binding protein